MMEKVEVLERSGGEFSTHCQVLTNLLSSFNHLAKGTGVETELCVGQCIVLLAQWVGCDSSHSSLKVFVLKSALRKAVSQVRRPKLSPHIVLPTFPPE